MTIRDRTMNERLSNLQYCASNAPEGTYETAKAVVDAIDDAMDTMMEAFKAAGLNAPGDDRARNLEVAIYAYLMSDADNEWRTAADEGFGAAIQCDDIAERVMADTIRNRDFIQSIRS